MDLSTLTQRDGVLPTLIFSIGAFTALSLLYQLLSFLLLFLRPSKLHRYRHDTKGKPAWALVTGASDGIGKQLARELAWHGFNVAIHGRNPTKLAAVQDELLAEFPTRQFRVLVADASLMPCTNCEALVTSPAKSTRSHAPDSKKQGATPGAVDFDALAAAVADLNLTVLVNNVGGTPYRPVYQYLQDVPPAHLGIGMNVNAAFPLYLTSKLLPQLFQCAPALVINVGSMSDNGLPMLGAYCPNKAHNIKVTQVLAREIAMQGLEKDVEVFAVRVGEVCGTVYNKSTPSLFEPDARTMARATLARVGCGRVVVDGYFWHALQSASLAWVPGFVLESAFRDVIKTRYKEDQEKLKNQ